MLLAAGGSSNGPVETAVKLARDRARVVDIGKTRLDLPWNAYYDKEIDVRFTMTYQPDVDFPVALALLASRAVDPAAMISDHIPLADLVDRGLEELLHHADRHVKILVDPAGAGT